MKPLISIIYVYYNTPDEIEKSIQSIARAVNFTNYEIILVDNASTQKIPRKVFLNKKIVYVKNKVNKGYGGGMNEGIKYAKGTYLLFLNPDTVFYKNAISLMVKKMEKDKHIGLLGPQIVSQEGNILPSISGEPLFPQVLFAFTVFAKLWKSHPWVEKYWLFKKDRTREQKVAVVGGACMLTRKEVISKISGFDDQFFLYFEESDLAIRVKKLGYSILYFPQAKIEHTIGASLKNKDEIQKHYERSRFLLLKKHYGFILALSMEAFIRFFSIPSLLLSLVLTISLTLNLYKINSLIMFIGDFGRDFLVARDLIINHTIPLVGIQSSVVWLHQGALSIYLIALAFLVGSFNPIAPAILYALLGVATTYLVYKIARKIMSSYWAVLASFIFATSPFTVVAERMPYHTAPIPFFASIVFLLLISVIHEKRKLLPVLFFFLGLLLQFELSNAVVFLVTFLVLYIYKIKFPRKDVLLSLGTFIISITPLIMYDFTHKFVQTLGFPLWIINRVRLFLGLTNTNNGTTKEAGNGLISIWEHIARAIFPENQIVVLLLCFLLIISFVLLRKDKLNKNLIVVCLWFFVPLIGYTIHAAPGPAYFPLLMPPLAILLAWMYRSLNKFIKYFFLIAIVLGFLNAYFLINKSYYLQTVTLPTNGMPPSNYSFGTAIAYQNEIAQDIVKDAKQRDFYIVGGGFIGTLETGADTFHYLAWYHGGKEKSNAKLQYIVYQDKNSIPKQSTIIYQNNFYFVTKNETN